MTEDDAKTKWCPFARHVILNNDPSNLVSEDIGPFNRLYTQESADEKDVVFHDMAKCLGSACSAWRWRVQKAESPDKREGFCGLSGPGNTT